MAPVLPQINITPPRGAKQRDTQDVYNAFNMQLKAESNRQSPLQSFGQGMGAVQEIVQGQQRIETNRQAQELNELEKERRELALNLQKEQQAEDVAFTKSIKTGDLNEQTNALLSTSPDVLIRNKDAALAVADRVRAKGSPEQAQIIEEEVMPIIDRQRVEAQKAQEQKRIRDREEFKIQEGERRETAKVYAERARKTPEELEHEVKLAEIKRDTALAKQRAVEAPPAQATPTAKDVLGAVKTEQQELTNFLKSSPQTMRMGQALEMRSKRETARALQTGQDEAKLQQTLTTDFLKALDPAVQKKFSTRSVEIAAATAAREKIAGPGVGALVGMDSSGEARTGNEATAAISEKELNTQAMQIVAQTKATARRQGITIIADDETLLRKAKEKILAGLK